MILGPGPFKAKDLPSKSQYELDDGHAVLCLPTLGRGGSAQSLGARVIGTDPAVQHSGVEVGFQLAEGTLRAPDVAVMATAPDDGWAQGAPPLAIEYADRGQDEVELQRKIEQFLQGGTRAVWVVRLGRIRQVEVNTRGPQGQVVRVIAQAHDTLTLPGVLQNPVPVAALFDADQADVATLRNLLDRFGYVHPDQARQEGREEGREEGARAMVLSVLRARGVAAPEALVAGMDREGLIRLLAE